MSKKYETKVLEICENGDAIIEFPADFMEDTGWLEDDIIDFRIENDVLILTNCSKKLRDEGKIYDI